MAKRSSVPKGPNNGTKVEQLKERKLAVDALANCGSMYLFTIIFSIFGIIFIIPQIPAAAKIALGIVFAIPVGIVQFTKGKNAGEKEYKLRNRTTLSDIHSQKINKVNPFKSLILVAPFLVSAILLSVIAVAAKAKWLQGLMLLVFIPMTLVFQGAGLIALDETSTVTWYSVVAVVIFTVVVSAAYVAGYFFGVYSLKKRSSELINEIRSYE